MRSGWIKLNRQLLDNPLWTAEPFSKAQAWVDLLLLANHKPNKFIKKGQVIEVERGQLAFSVLSLVERWKWSKNKVLRFLSVLESETMIERKSNHLTSVITICNYSSFQDRETPDETPNETPDETPNGSSDETRSRSKEVKEVKKTNNSQSEKCDFSEAVDAWNEFSKLNGLKEIKGITPTRRKKIQTAYGHYCRIKRSFKAEPKPISVFLYGLVVIASRKARTFHLGGENGDGWRMDFDYLLHKKTVEYITEHQDLK